tara:strand:+ start:225 stop:551 length:327 start_codon:yes stop_codon:yes gene_type:complete
MTERKAGRPGLHERASNDTVLDIDLGLGSSSNNSNNLDNLDDLDLELGWGTRFVKPASMQLDTGDYSPKSVVPSEPSFAPEQAHANTHTRTHEHESAHAPLRRAWGRG